MTRVQPTRAHPCQCDAHIMCWRCRNTGAGTGNGAVRDEAGTWALEGHWEGPSNVRPAVRAGCCTRHKTTLNISPAVYFGAGINVNLVLTQQEPPLARLSSTHLQSSTQEAEAGGVQACEGSLGCGARPCPKSQCSLWDRASKPPQHPRLPRVCCLHGSRPQGQVQPPSR